MSDTYDLVVIGSGPAGEEGAVEVAYYGKKVALIERETNIGGAGINTGTVPSKTLRETALYFSGLRQRGLYGIDYSLKDNMTVADFMHREHLVVENERRITLERLQKNNVGIIHGTASISDAHTVHVHQPDGSEIDLKAENILIATGSSPFHPPNVPFDGKYVLDSDTVLGLEAIPDVMTVVGGGVVGCEYASIFAAMGVKVSLIENHDRLLAYVDDEIADRLQAKLESLALRFIFNETVVSTVVQDNKVHLMLKGGEALVCDTALFATGRQSNTAALGLDKVGVTCGARGLIVVNEKYQTNIPSIYAAGDVIGYPALASTSMEQGRVAMVHAFGLDYEGAVSPILPLAVYTIPEISWVGITEEECVEKKIPYLVGRAYYDNNARGQIIGDMSGMLKLIFSPTDKKLLGVHHIGELAAELVHIGLAVISEEGTIDKFIHTVFNYPTLSDVYKYAAIDGYHALEHWREAQGKDTPPPPAAAAT